MQTPPPTWEDVAWLRREWGGPFMLKGVTRVDDAKRAVDAGVSAISVSNHGGNNLDGTPATIRALQPVTKAVGDQVEVLLDGGIRRGSDVVKALALGAKAVMIGRAYLWGLAANGQAGVENVLDLLRSSIESTLLGLGLAEPNTVPSNAWLNMARLKRLSWTSIWLKGAMAVTTMRASFEPSAHAEAIRSPLSTLGVRITTSAFRPWVSSGSKNWASRMDATPCVAPTSFAFSS